MSILKPFHNPDGTTSQAGQTNAGTWLGSTGQPNLGQQPNESWEAKTNRDNAFIAEQKRRQGS